MRDETTNESQQAETVVVGVGASAGGLEAFQDLFSRLSRDHDFAIVLVQHLDPDHESLLQELLSKRTQTPVHNISDGMDVLPGNIYLIPPGASLTIKDGKLHLKKFETPRGQRRPIDTFFESLADDVGRNAVAIVLSGTGSDGSHGARAVKEKGGLVFAQDINQAKYDGMPKSAIATGAVDLTLKTAEMIDVLNDFHQRRSGIEPTIENDQEFVAKVFKHLRYQTGHDFTHYKQATLRRRLSVRMSVLGIIDPADYVKQLIQSRDEAARLFRDVLINVTSFFRDKDAFEALRKSVIPEILRDRGRDQEVRIWVPGCSTGQEAYTMGILVLEELSRTDAKPQVVIFGTDIDDEALRVARAGHYPNTIADEVPAEYLEEYFMSTAEGYEVGKQLRSLVRFSHQSLVKDPPFSKLDLISCRNVTIYFEKKLQDVALSVFHYSLKPGGFLMLGLSESPRDLKGRFDEIDNLNRLFRRNKSPSLPLNLPLGPLSRSSILEDETREGRRPARADEVRDAILARHVSPYIVMNAQNSVTYASAGTERYLQLKPGDLRLEITAVIHPSLAPIVRRLLLGADPGDSGKVRTARFSGDLSGVAHNLEMTAERLPGGNLILVFHSLDTIDQPETVFTVEDMEQTDYIRELELELEHARQTIRTTVEELETSNEELKSSNEEMMSMNEELQSANEELSTINEELQSKVTDLNALNADLSSFIESTGMATVFLDHEMCVRRFTPEARKHFRFTETDIGRSIADIASDIPISDFCAGVRDVISTGELAELELQSLNGESELMIRIAASDGMKNEKYVVATIVDVTDIRQYAKDAEKARVAAQLSLNEIEQLYSASPIGMSLIDPDLRYLRVNTQLAEINGFSVEHHIGKTVGDIAPALGKAAEDEIKTVMLHGKPVLNKEIVGRTNAHESDRVWITDWYPIMGEDGVRAVGVNVRDITVQKEMGEELRRVMRELQHRVKNMLSNVSALINRAKNDPRDPGEVLDTLSKRIVALSNTHKLLTASNWRHTSLAELIRPELLDVYGEDVIQYRGPQVYLNSKATLALGMVVHELGTNAAKYGCLSVPEGRLQLRWSRIDEGEGDLLRLYWEETGGPDVVAPERGGFGSTLIASMVERTLDGQVEMEWKPVGLHCRIDINYQLATEGEDELESDLF